MRIYITIGLWLLFALPSFGYAQTVPGPADVGRIKPEEKNLLPDRSEDQHIHIPSLPLSTIAPAAAKDIGLVLADVKIEGMTAFSVQEMHDIYAPYVGKNITLDLAWTIASELTRRYRDAGYFLSRAYVPAQEIENDTILIRVVEGYIGEVELNDPIAEYYTVRKLIVRLKQERPSTNQTLESFLLRVNDLPGLSFRAVLSALENPETSGAVKLVLIPSEEEGKGSISFDNQGSRFLGPHELSVAYQTSFLPLQKTSFSTLTSLPFDELRYATLSHEIAIAPDLMLELNGGVTRAYPGHNLESFDINSQSVSAGIGLAYQWIRQRQENLTLKLLVDGRNTSSDLLSSALVRDRIRAAHVNIAYDNSDRWRGSNVINFTLTQGIDGLGSSEKGEANLSRAAAEPDFLKGEISLMRLQNINADWSILGSASGQVANGALYSSEEFGYGGQAFGRAYDASEITGDHGVSGSLELRYAGLQSWDPVSLTPYIFYDIGKIWNEDAGQLQKASASSAGFGAHFSAPFEISGNIGVAFPLTRDAGTPIYGGNGKSPRLILRILKEF